MTPEFSEFTYGYTLIEEISRELGFSSVPTFPSLIQEGKSGGYDVKVEIIDVPYFIQFKRSDFLSRSNSKYYDEFKSPYYRFDLRAMKKSKQHLLLQELEATGVQVYYVAPKFYKDSELRFNYMNKRIGTESFWIEPSRIGILPDNEAHSVCFNYREDDVKICSEPTSIEYDSSLKAESLSTFLTDRIDSRDLPERRWTWGSLYEEMSRILNQREPLRLALIKEHGDEEISLAVRVSKMALLGFGARLIIKKKVTRQRTRQAEN